MMCWWRTDKNPSKRKVKIDKQTTTQREREKKKTHNRRIIRTNVEMNIENSIVIMAQRIANSSSMWAITHAMRKPKAKQIHADNYCAISYLCHSLFDKHHFRSMCSFHNILAVSQLVQHCCSLSEAVSHVAFFTFTIQSADVVLPIPPASLVLLFRDCSDKMKWPKVF